MLKVVRRISPTAPRAARRLHGVRPSVWPRGPAEVRGARPGPLLALKAEPECHGACPRRRAAAAGLFEAVTERSLPSCVRARFFRVCTPPMDRTSHCGHRMNDTTPAGPCRIMMQPACHSRLLLIQRATQTTIWRNGQAACQWAVISRSGRPHLSSNQTNPATTISERQLP